MLTYIGDVFGKIHKEIEGVARIFRAENNERLASENSSVRIKGHKKIY